MHNKNFTKLMQQYTRIKQAGAILEDVRRVYETWQAEYALEDVPAAEVLFMLPIPEIMRWFRYLAQNLMTHRVHPDMVKLFYGVIGELEALGYQVPKDE
jgi:hypothetical protein